MADQFPFTVLFCFEDEFKLITEIKRTDIQSENKSLVYKWLWIDKNSLQVQQLTFQAMDQANGEQIRNFSEGILRWNAEAVRFNEEEMDRVDPELTNPEWLKYVTGFLIGDHR